MPEVELCRKSKEAINMNASISLQNENIMDMNISRWSDIGLAKELSDKYRSTYKGNDISNSPKGKRDVMDWYKETIGAE